MNFFACVFLILKKHTRKPPKFLPIPPNITMAPLHTKKTITLIIMLKKNTYKSENILINPLILNITTLMIMLKKHTRKPQNFLPIPTNTAITPFHTQNN